MTSVIEYTVGAELPDVTFAWKDSAGALIDFSSGWTFELRISTTPTTIKTTGITGAATDPNVTVAIATTDFTAIAPRTYAAQLWARRTADSKDRVLPFILAVKAAVV